MSPVSVKKNHEEQMGTSRINMSFIKCKEQSYLAFITLGYALTSILYSTANNQIVHWWQVCGVKK